MEIAVVVQDVNVFGGIQEIAGSGAPWIFYRNELKNYGFDIHIFEEAQHDQAFGRSWDAMLLQVWQDWNCLEHFRPGKILPLMARYSEYRAKYPKTIQIMVNHVDMCRKPYVTPYWRIGDPILYRTPAYDRTELAPLPPEDIWPYELVYGGSACFKRNNPKYNAGFIGSPSGAPGYRQSVAGYTSVVGIGLCSADLIDLPRYHEIMSDCRIIVCPSGWGETSLRHWDTWLSKKPMLTDRGTDSVEIIPGQRLQDKVHYLVYDRPEQIPDIVSDWSRPSRAADLEQIAENGYRVAIGYNPLACIVGSLKSLDAYTTG